MWAERMRREWQHTSLMTSYLHNANVGKKSQTVKPDAFNPMELGTKKQGIPLNSPEGFTALSKVAGQWRGRR